jgi:hypothetical protein
VWQLICHHEYCWGTITADHSPWHSDGIPSGVAPLLGEVGLRFSSLQSGVAIPRKANDPWQVLGALHVEIIARLTQPGGTLIHGDQSFRLWLNNQQTLMVEGPGYALALGTLPVGQWARISFHHNGLNLLNLGYSYPVPATTGPGGGGGGGAPTAGQVPGVGPQGVLIGNRIGNPGDYLHGDIARVMVWRLDPYSMMNEFLTRPLDRALSECWAKFFAALNETLRNEPRCAEWLQSVVLQLQQDFLKSLAQKSPAKIEEFRVMCRAYRELWRAGKVGGPEMLALVAKLRDWLKAEGLFSIDDRKLMRMVDNPCLRTSTGRLPSLNCDPEVQTLIQAILGDRGSELKTRRGCLGWLQRLFRSS